MKTMGDEVAAYDCRRRDLERSIENMFGRPIPIELLSIERLAQLHNVCVSLDALREFSKKDLFIDLSGVLREPCSDDCPGYGAFDCERPPHENLVYDHDPALELEMCLECRRFESDEAAYEQWVKDGKPVLGFSVESEPPDDITIYALLEQLAKQAKKKGWDLSKLQDEVYAHFETTEG